jgi:hypothetical protein
LGLICFRQAAWTWAEKRHDPALNGMIQQSIRQCKAKRQYPAERRSIRQEAAKWFRRDQREPNHPGRNPDTSLVEVAAEELESVGEKFATGNLVHATSSQFEGVCEITKKPPFRCVLTPKSAGIPKTICEIKSLYGKTFST